MHINKIIIAAVTVFVLGLFVDSQAKVIYVGQKPPAAKLVVEKPKPPVHNTVWISGHWSWNGNKYVWVSGRWEKQRTGYVWVDGHWKHTPRGWVWIKGHWRKR